jgi:hypothetical protein
MNVPSKLYGLCGNKVLKSPSPQNIYKAHYNIWAKGSLYLDKYAEMWFSIVTYKTLRGCGDLRGWLRDTKIEVYPQL